MATRHPAVASLGTGRLDLFVRGDDQRVHRQRYFNGWGPWDSVPVEVVPPLTVYGTTMATSLEEVLMPQELRARTRTK